MPTRGGRRKSLIEPLLAYERALCTTKLARAFTLQCAVYLRTKKRARFHGESALTGL
jgi:hypothetical protein